MRYARSALALLLVGLVAAPAAPVRASETEWRDVLIRLVSSPGSEPYEGRLVVVSFVGGTPSVSEVEVSSARDGSLTASRESAWIVGHGSGHAFLGDVSTGKLLRADAGRRSTFSLARLAHNYDMSVVGERHAAGRSTTVVEIRPSGGDVLRERLYVDRDAGLLLRRETFDDTGQPVRLAAFTTLDLRGSPATASGEWVEEHEPVSTSLSRRGVRILRSLGWVVPEGLPGGFGIVDTGSVGGTEDSALHVLYSDGLYGLSIYQQQGRLDERALRRRGAERVRLGAGHVHRWPANEPATYVWGAGGLTFTAVSDAPPDVIATAVSALPHDGGGSVIERLRGLLDRAFGRDGT